MRAMKLMLIFGLISLTSQLAKADGPDPAHTTVMPNIDVSNQPVDKVLEQLRAAVPWFHYVIFRQAGAPKDEPKLPAMSLDGVTVEQFLKLITDEYPTIISIKKLDGDKTPLYEVNIADPNKLPWKDTEAGRAAVEPVMKVFPLADIVARMNGANDPKKAMDDILSLVQAALDASGGDPKNPPALKVHQPTQTLIYKGPPDKMAVLSQVLDTLRPKDSEATAQVRRELEMQLVRSEAELAETRQELADARQSIVYGGQVSSVQVAKIISEAVKEKQGELESAKTTYGPNHPRVVQLQHELDLLNDKLKQVTTQPSK